MTKFKAFGYSGELPPQGVPPMDLKIYDRLFKVRGSMAGIRLIRVMNALDGADDTEYVTEPVLTPTGEPVLDSAGKPVTRRKKVGNSAMETFLEFLSDAFLTANRAEAMDFLANCGEDAIDEEGNVTPAKYPPVSFSTIMDIITWLIEEYTGNPTGSPESSSANSRTNGHGSTENASSTEPTSAILMPTPSGMSPSHIQPVTP